MENHSVKNGLWCGLGQILLSLVLYFVNAEFMLSWGSLLGYVFIIYFMQKAVADTRMDHKGFITFGEAFKAGWLTYILGSVLITIFTFVLMNYIDPGLLEKLKVTQVEALEKMGELLHIPEADLEEQISAIEDTNPFGITTIAYALPFSFIFPGAMIALIMALIMKKQDPTLT